MKPEIPKLLSLICIASMLGLLLSACGEEPPPFIPPPQLVQTMRVAPPEVSIVRRLPGRVQAHRKAELAFQVSGPLTELPIKEGDIVGKDALLARIDPRDFQNQLNARKADEEETLKQFKRFEQLLKTKTVPVDQYEERKARYEIAAAARVQAEKELDDTYLRAPFDGLISKRYVENFQNVKAKQKIVLLEQVSQLDVVIQVEEQVLADVKPDEELIGTEVGSVTFQAIPDKEYPVTIKEYRTRADSDTQTYRATLTLPAPKEAFILPGMTAVFLPSYENASPGERVYKIPVTAVTTAGDGKPFVWLVDRETMTVKAQPIKVGELVGSDIQVLDGLKTDAEIVTLGTHYLTDGDKIRFAEKAEEAQS